MKRMLIKIICGLLTMTIPVALLIAGFMIPSQFNETYYGEAAVMFRKLKNTEGKKIVFVGNSTIAFGIRSDLLQEEFPEYTVVNFGLYGSLGTKLMMDLSKVNIGEGDIVVILPEPVRQPSSLYFSAKEAWRAVDADIEMLSYIAPENRAEMFGAFLGYVQEKVTKFEGAVTDSSEGIYSREAFITANGENVDYMVMERPYNIMSGGYDPTMLASGEIDYYGEGFIDYLNEYCDYARKKGAEVYFGFCPVDSLSSVLTEELADAQYAFLAENLEMNILGHPMKYVLDYRWFYDNNVHLNSSGAILYTDMLAEDLKLALGIGTPNNIEIPEMPEIPVSVFDRGNNTDAEFFTYSVISAETGSFIKLTGLTEEGEKKTSLRIPSDYDGMAVREFDVSVFCGNTVISEIIIGSNITTIYDGSFAGATRLAKVVFEHDSVLGLNIGVNFLTECDSCEVYVRKGVNTTNCAGGWEQYKERIVYY